MKPARDPRRRRWPGLLLAAALLASGPVAALQLQMDPEGLDGHEQDASQGLLDDTVSMLPPAMAAAIEEPIRVRWDATLAPGIYGRATRGTLLLNRRLLPRLVDGTSAMAASPRPERSELDQLRATLLHEVTHFYDRTGGGGGRLSGDPRLLDLAGWQVGAFPWSRRSGNHFTDRSPDPYELESAREFVAVNVEYFLLDPGYACRRPALHRHFREHFGWAPPADACPAGLPFLDPDPDSGGALTLLDPARVYQVHYLLAEGNEQLMSRWGHGMLRLVVCAPGRERGPDCLLDLQHHRVLSFRAFVDDVQLSSWRGLTGSYPSRLFVLPLDQVVDEYTKDQLRALQSVPLELSQEEIAGVVERAARLHWSYDGEYYFLSNNCAVETFKLLHDGAPRLATTRLRSITPTGLMGKLRKQAVADVSVLEDRDEALRLGYRFDSMRERQQAMYAVALERLGLPEPQVEQWLDLPAARRAAWVDKGDMQATAALLLLEQAAQRRRMLEARDELKRRYSDAGDASATEGFGEVADHLRRMLVDSGFLSRPAALLEGRPGYGLPQGDELAWMEEEGARRQARLEAMGVSLAEQVGPLLDPRLRGDLENIDANVDALAARMRALHAAQGGLRLP